jgi:plasmid replication initiation protein
MSTEPEQLIALIATHTRNLLKRHWSDIDSYRDGESEIKLAFSHTLSYEGSERTIKTTISFSHRIKDSLKESINSAQQILPLEEF